jgi:hypothetical protein
MHLVARHAMASSLKVRDTIALLQAGLPGGFACAAQAQLAAKLRTEKLAKAVARGELLDEEEEDGECPAKGKVKGTGKSNCKGTRGRGGQERPARPHQQQGALALALVQALKAVSELPKEGRTLGHTDSNKCRSSLARSLKAGGPLPMQPVTVCREDAADGKPTNDTKDHASTGSLKGAKRKLGIVHEPVEVPKTLSRVSQLSDAKLSPAKDTNDPASTNMSHVDVKGPKTLSSLSLAVDAESAEIPAAGCTAEPLAATAVAPASTASGSNAAFEAPCSCWVLFMCMAFV